MTLVDHLPAVHQPWWQTFIQVGTPIITAATSIITVSVLISNRKLTKQVADSNYELAKENKEISRKNFDADIYEKMTKLYIDYNDLYSKLTEQNDEFFDADEENLEYHKKLNMINNDTKNRLNTSLKIRLLFNSSEPIMSKKTAEAARAHLDNFDKYISHVTVENFLENYDDQVSPIFNSRAEQINDANKILDESNLNFLESFKLNEIMKFSSFKN
ncbi:hypothetical protein AA3250_1844 [Gluconobacter albidus NBRC 3250]|nr:hypothetical protein AA3250_1844 [Gluconobacter albidus NBRC 3250]